MSRCCTGLLIVAASAFCVGTANSAAVEDPASNLLPPAINGADTMPSVPPSAEAPQRVPAAAAAPATTTSGVTFQRSGDQLLITIQMIGAMAAKLAQSENEVLLAFPHALPPFNTQALLDRAKGLLAGVSVGFDTLLLQLAPGIAIGRNDSGNVVRLVVQPAAATGETAGSAPDAGELRLRLLDAQLLARTGDTAAAREKLQALLTQMPDSPEPLAALAGIDEQQGRWRLALSEYERAEHLDPGNPAIEDAVASINREQGSRIRTDLEYRQTDGGIGTGRATAVIEGLSGHQIFGDGWRIGFTSDLAQVNADQVQRVNGSITSFSGTLGRTEVYLQHDWLEGQVFGVSLYSNGDTVGAGAHGELPDNSGTTLLRAEYRRPDWDFFQSIINQGTRDRVALGRRQQFGHDLTGRLEVAVNRYNVQGQSDVDRTVTLTGELRLGNLAGFTGLSVAYVFDAEYLLSQSKRIAADGSLFSPLQLVDREVHALTLAYAGSLGSSATVPLTYEFSGGYGADRYGKAGPLLGAVLGYTTGHFEARVRASYVENIGRSRGMSQVYGCNVAWIF